MKLNYTSLQHAVRAGRGGARASCQRPLGLPVAVLALHGQLPCAAFALAARGAGRARGLRADRRRRAAGRAVGHGRRPARARPARRPRDRRALLRRRAARRSRSRGRSTPARARSGWDCALVGPGPGHPRLGLGARPRRPGGARERARGAVARLPGGARAAAVERATRASATAASATTRATVLELLLRPVRGRGPGPALAAVERRRSSGARARAGTRRSRSTSPSCVDAYLASGLPATHDGALVRRGPRLLPRRRSPAGPLLARQMTPTKGAGLMASSGSAARTIWRGPDRHRARGAVPPRRRRGRPARGGRASRAPS